MAPSVQRLLSGCALVLGAAAAGQYGDDEMVLIQADARVEMSTHAKVIAASGPKYPLFYRHHDPDCSATPTLCKPPLNCDKQDRIKLDRAVAPDGKPNYNSWCGLPWEVPAAECATGNLKGYATGVHEVQLSMAIGKRIEKVDAHYCFSWGHCDSNVTEDTTVDEMVSMCDQRFGRDQWTSISLSKASKAMMPQALGGEMITNPPHMTPEGQTQFAMLSCAQGNYHCDAWYCKQEFCSKPEWVELYGSLKQGAASSVQLRQTS